jgi:RimJ/RimL family protein N-acetyltransferase
LTSVPDPVTGLPIGPEIDPHPAPRPQRVTLPGRFVTLVPLDPAAHGDSLCEQSHGPDKDRIWQYLFEPPFPDRASFQAHLDRKAESEDPLFFAVVDNASGAALGYQTLMRIDTAHRVIEVGNVMYGAGLQRTPGATEAQHLFAAHVFDALGYRRYEWKCNALNAPSLRAAERLGFTFEGVFRQHMIVRGRNRDTAWFSILDHEWPAAKAAFERWLAPENFDAEGRQRESLQSLRRQSS